MTELEELKAENERLKAELDKAETIIQKFKHMANVHLESISKERRRSEGLNLEIEELKSSVRTYKESFDTITKSRKTLKICPCGCDKRLIQPKTGRKRKYFNDACRKRFNRLQKKRLLADKNYTQKKRSPETSENS